MDPIPGTKITFPDPDNLMKFEVAIKPNDGLYKGATFQFTVEIPTTYPYDPPKVLCNTMVIFYYKTFCLIKSRSIILISTGKEKFV